MSRVKMYAEGGGDGKETSAKIRIGLETFFRSLGEHARSRRLRFGVVACGGRDQAYSAFRNALETESDVIAVLLVDAESALNGSPIQHLRNRDRWQLGENLSGRVFVMCQVMETWIVSDSAALVRYYGQGFNVKSLPVTHDLELVDKKDINRALAAATRHTNKEQYEKIRDGSRLLEKIDADVVRRRCAHCEEVFVTIEALIAS